MAKLQDCCRQAVRRAVCARSQKRLMPWIALTLFLLSGGQINAAPGDWIELPALKAWSERSHCPSTDMLNAASRHYHQSSFQYAFLDESYAERRGMAGLPAHMARDDIRRLRLDRDFEACHTLNRWFEANVLYDVDHVFDTQREEYLPYVYPMYYRVGQRFAILLQPYNPGRFEAGVAPSPIPSRMVVFVFDEHFSKIGQYSL